MNAPAVGSFPTPEDHRIDQGDTVAFGTVDPPTLAQPKIDDRGSRIPRQYMPQQPVDDGQSHRNLPQHGWNAIADMVRDQFSQADGGPFGDDLEWIISLVEVHRATDNEELRADLLNVLLTRPPVGEIGDRVAAVYLKHAQRLIDSACAERGMATVSRVLGDLDGGAVAIHSHGMTIPSDIGDGDQYRTLVQAAMLNGLAVRQTSGDVTLTVLGRVVLAEMRGVR